jgi:hypothetical protein
LAMHGLVGVTEIDTSVAGVTLKVVNPDMLPDTAVMAVVPTIMEVANPFEFDASLTVATDSVDELQVTAVVRSCVVLFE